MMRKIPATAMMLGVLIGAVSFSSAGAAQRFYDDDPLARELATQDASKADENDIDLFYDITSNLFVRQGDPTPNVRAKDINTIDEVPDSDWFTNRILATTLSVDQVVKGPLAEGPPSGTHWTITRPKKAGVAPGFTARDDDGHLWFVSFDAKGYPEAATGAILVANKIFWALGYWQVENYLVAIRPELVRIDEKAQVTPPSGKKRQMQLSDLEAILGRAQQSADGSYRAIAAKALPGKVLGSFKYFGTRPDDPNDLIPHEHRRELRALKVFGAWTNLVDMKAGNTLDTRVDEEGRGIVRHYLQDVGSTFGTGANGPREYDEGWEYTYEGGPLWKRLVSFGLYTPRWETIHYVEYPAIGRFEGKEFDPTVWKPRVPTAAFVRARPDDDFWAARRVMAFTDGMIRAIVKTGHYSDPQAESHLADVLIERRDKIGRAYLPAVNPLVDFALDETGALTFDNVAVTAEVAEAPARGYSAAWFSFDNDTGGSSPLGVTQSATETMTAPSALSQNIGDFVMVQVAAVDSPHEAWNKPVDVTFRRTETSWKLVGLERLP